MPKFIVDLHLDIPEPQTPREEYEQICEYEDYIYTALNSAGSSVSIQYVPDEVECDT